MMKKCIYLVVLIAVALITWVNAQGTDITQEKAERERLLQVQSQNIQVEYERRRRAVQADRQQTREIITTDYQEFYDDYRYLRNYLIPGLSAEQLRRVKHLAHEFHAHRYDIIDQRAADRRSWAVDNERYESYLNSLLASYIDNLLPFIYESRQQVFINFMLEAYELKRDIRQARIQRSQEQESIRRQLFQEQQELRVVRHQLSNIYAMVDRLPDIAKQALLQRIVYMRENMSHNEKILALLDDFELYIVSLMIFTDEE